MENNVRTVYGTYIQTCQFLKEPVTLKPNSTLNQKWNIFENELFSLQEFPNLEYMVIGNKGHTTELGTDNIPLVTSVPHSPRHASLYRHLPFVIRELNNDLNAAERAQYRLRTTDVFGGVEYAVYYAKVIDKTNSSPVMELRNITNGVITTTAFSPSLSDLNPTQPTVPPGGNFTATGDYLASTAKLIISLDANDITEIMNASNIIYGDPRYAFISEVGVCTGVDRVLNTTINGAPADYTEGVGVQVSDFISTAIPLYAMNDSATHTVDVGAVEPLFF